MKFKDLYNKVFIKEQEERAEIADPKNFDDVAPMPLPAEPAASSEEENLLGDTGGSEVSSSTLTDYINQIEDFAGKLNGTDGDSLQSLVSKLDKVETPFEGIYSRTSAEIVDAAKTLRSVSEKLKNFIIHAQKTKGV